MQFYFLAVFPFLTVNIVGGAVYENVSVVLTSKVSKDYVNGNPPKILVLISSGDGLDRYVNHDKFHVVQIQNQKIPKLSKGSVADLANVTELSITSCGLKHLEPATFRNLPKLKSLNLSANLLEEIKNDVFAGMTVEYLYLQNNAISEIHSKAFNGMSLKHIFLDGNAISRWRGSWFDGTPVTSISMSDNAVQELPADSFRYYLPFKIPSYPLSLWYLVLKNNRLKTIHQDAFKGLDEILYLDLGHNRLETLPVNLFRTVKYVNNLELSYNHIRKINVTRTLSDTRLAHVKLDGNQLHCVDVEIVNVTRVAHLSLEGNPVGCGCVRKWKKWQEENQKVVVVLDNLEDSCVEAVA